MFHPDRYVRAKTGLITQRCGITEKAAEQKRYSLKWREGRQYVIGPDGNCYYDLLEIHKWIRGE